MPFLSLRVTRSKPRYTPSCAGRSFLKPPRHDELRSTFVSSFGNAANGIVAKIDFEPTNDRPMLSKVVSTACFDAKAGCVSRHDVSEGDR